MFIGFFLGVVFLMHMFMFHAKLHCSFFVLWKLMFCFMKTNIFYEDVYLLCEFLFHEVYMFNLNFYFSSQFLCHDNLYVFVTILIFHDNFYFSRNFYVFMTISMFHDHSNTSLHIHICFVRNTDFHKKSNCSLKRY